MGGIRQDNLVRGRLTYEGTGTAYSKVSALEVANLVASRSRVILVKGRRIARKGIDGLGPPSLFKGRASPMRKHQCYWNTHNAKVALAVHITRALRKC